MHGAPVCPRCAGVLIQAGITRVVAKTPRCNTGIKWDEDGLISLGMFVEVKIDRSFVSGCSSNKLKHGLCQTVVDLAHRFGATACAEGVETVEDLHALVGMQCDSAQGFLFAKPMPPDELESALLAWSEKSLRALLQTSSGKDRWLEQSA